MKYISKKAKARRLRGLRALRSGASAVLYEWKTAHDSANLAIEAKKKNDQASLNAALESLLLHARNIREFFRVKGRDNDILARDFLGAAVKVRMPYLRKNRTRLDRNIAHLSYSRSRMAPHWDVNSILIEIDDSMNRFVKRLESVHRSIARDIFEAL